VGSNPAGCSCSGSGKTWLIRLLGVQENAGSNPAIPTDPILPSPPLRGRGVGGEGAEVPKQKPLTPDPSPRSTGARGDSPVIPTDFAMWGSWSARHFRKVENAGSSPAIATAIQGSSTVEPPAVNRKVVGPIPTPEADWKGQPIGDGPPLETGRGASP
jgi:hypothetical protein